MIVDGRTERLIEILKRHKYLLLFLALSTIIPYLLVFSYLSSISNGVHGTLYPASNSAINTNVIFNEGYESTEGYLNGTVVVDNSYGWLFCNGNIQQIGTYQIDDAELHYKARPYQISPHSMVEPAEITLSGDKGNLRTGCPIAVFSLLVVPFGIIACLVWLMVQKLGVKTHTVAWFAIFATYIITQIVLLLTEINIIFMSWILLGCALFFFYFMRESKKKFLYYLGYIDRGVQAKYLRRFPLFYAVIGFLLFLFNFFILGTHYFSIIIISMYLAVVPLAWGIGAIIELRKYPIIKTITIKKGKTQLL